MPNTKKLGQIAGPDNRTNTDLYNVMVQIRDRLPVTGVMQQMAIDITQIKDDIRKFVGAAAAPATWSGAPAELDNTSQRLLSIFTYMQQNIGFALADEGIPTAIDMINLIRRTLYSPTLTGNTIWQLIDALEVGGGGGTPVEPIDYTTALQTIAAGITGLGAQLNVIEQNTARVADCCEDGGGGTDPDPGENPPPDPSLGCELANGPMRAVGYQFRRNLPAEQLDEYIILFTGIGTESNNVVVEDVSNDTVPLPGLAVPPAGTLCLEWNLSEGQVPSQVRIYQSSPSGSFAGVSGVNVSGLFTGEGGAVPVDVEGGELGMFVARVPEGTGEPQHKNWWLKWESSAT